MLPVPIVALVLLRKRQLMHSTAGIPCLQAGGCQRLNKNAMALERSFATATVLRRVPSGLMVVTPV